MTARFWQCVLCGVTGHGVRSHYRHNADYHPLPRDNRFGKMKVIASDQFTGRLYRCPCGWKGWSVWGHAIRHANTCPQARG